MTSMRTALALLIGFGISAAGAQAQTAPATGTQPEAEPSVSVSKKAHKQIVALQNAVATADRAAIASALTAAQAAASTNEDRYVIAQLQLKAAAAANDLPGVRAAADAMAASGIATPAKMGGIYLNLARVLYNNKQFDEAASTLERVLALNPNDTDSIVLLAETRNSQGRKQDAVAQIQRAIAVRSAAGQKAPAEWYRRSIAFAHDGKLPNLLELTRSWIAAYPNAESWRDGLRLYRNTMRPDEATTLDTLRLARLTGALSGDHDYHLYAFTAAEDGAAEEARSLLSEATAAKQIDPSKTIFKEAAEFTKLRTGSGRAGLAALTKDALAAPAARLAVRTAGSAYAFGEYGRAAELYRAALTKSGADKDLISLRLGMALAAAGDKAAAADAFKAVGGPRAELAKYWLLYLQTKS